jgi:glycosyl transferase family 25
MYSPYVISLKNPEDKLKYLRSHGLRPTWVEGVNGKLLTDDQISDNVNLWYGVFGPKSAIGCALSHIKVWKEIEASGRDYGIVMEDDVILEPQFEEKLTLALKHVPSDYDILYLGCFDSSFFTNIMGVMGMSNQQEIINKYIKRPRVALGAHAYVVSRQGAEKLIKCLDRNIYNHIDYCLQGLAAKGALNVYVTTPRIAYQTSTDTGDSANISSSHPQMLLNFFDTMEVDKKVRASYIASLSVVRVGDANLNIMSIVFLLLGIVLAMYGIRSNKLTIMFMLVSYRDIMSAKGPQSILWMHYLLFIVPSIIFS